MSSPPLLSLPCPGYSGLPLSPQLPDSTSPGHFSTDSEGRKCNPGPLGSSHTRPFPPPLATLPPVPSVLCLLWTLAAPNTPPLSTLPLCLLFLLLRPPALPSIHPPTCLAKRCSTSGPVTSSLFFSLTSPTRSVFRVFCSHLHYNWGGFGGGGCFALQTSPALCSCQTLHWVVKA